MQPELYLDRHGCCYRSSSIVFGVHMTVLHDLIDASNADTIWEIQQEPSSRGWPRKIQKHPAEAQRCRSCKSGIHNIESVDASKVSHIFSASLSTLTEMTTLYSSASSSHPVRGDAKTLRLIVVQQLLQVRRTKTKSLQCLQLHTKPLPLAIDPDDYGNRQA